jgi:nitrate reductase NapE component
VTARPATSGASAAAKERHTWLIILMIIFALLFIGFVGSCTSPLARRSV